MFGAASVMCSKGVSLKVGPRELLHISGPNGTGKTTLLRVASGLLRPEQGTVTWLGQSISSSSSRIPGRRWPMPPTNLR